ncbi:MAG: dihydropyrimidinase [Epulopiscium sp. Nuni2H_MBin003]|nr:MAG: dihydropyrimidinase [Epulopiscium sp. Nuni2H_MBin003]
MKHLLKGGTVVTGANATRNDILFDDETGKICEVGLDIKYDEATVTDVTGKLLFPGFIDAHTHFDLDVCDTTTADDFESGTKSAIIGGTTTIIDFATQNKGETLIQALQNWHDKADNKCSADYAFHMAISDWNDTTAADIKTMVEKGVTSFKLYMTYPAMVVNDRELYEILKTIKQAGGIVGVHCENMGLIDALVKEQKALGNLTVSSHPITRPDYAEAEAVNRLLKIAKVADTPVIIVHLSSKRAYDEIKGDQTVYLETCPQYLILDDEVYKNGRIEYACSPPIRKSEDRKTLWKALADGKIHTIATDHCSFTLDQKEVGRADFTKIPNGLPGVETRAILLYTFGVATKKITLEQMCKVLSENPAKLYGLYPNKGVIQQGSDADIVVWEDLKWKIDEKEQHSKAGYSPYHNMDVLGKPMNVYLRGKLIVQNGNIINEKQGAYQKRVGGNLC